MVKLSALLALLSGCFESGSEPPITCGRLRCSPPVPDPVNVMTVTPNLDVLFVIDDSQTMVDKQRSFQNAFPALLEALATVPGGTPNLHLAVVSSDMGTLAANGSFGNPIGTPGQGGCASSGKGGRFQLGTAVLPDEDDRFLVVNRDGTQNFEGSLAETFAAQSTLGAQGCGFEQHLAAAEAALSGGEGNDGFLRESANLAVIVLADEDDCSAENTTLFGPDGGPLGALQSFRCFRFGVECDEPTDTLGIKTNCRPFLGSPHVLAVDPFGEFLAELKGNAQRVLFGAVVGDPTLVQVESRVINGQPQTALAPSCRFPINGGAGEATADPGVRFAALAAGYTGPSNIQSICSEDLTAAAASLGGSLATLMRGCLPDQRFEGACFVEDRREATPDEVTALYPCQPGDSEGCFRFVDDAACPTGQRLEIVRPTPSFGDEWATLRCHQ